MLLKIIARQTKKRLLKAVFLYNIFYFDNLIRIAIANKINKTPIAINIIDKILFNCKFACS